MHPVTAISLLMLLVTQVTSAQPDNGKAPAPALLLLGSGNSSSKIEYPDFATPEEQAEEIKRPTLMTDDELDLLNSLENQPTSALIDLLSVYDRLGNPAMVQAIGELIEKRIPGQPDAERVRRMMQERETIRQPDYLDKQAAAVLGGMRASDPDAVDAQARSLLLEKRIAEATSLLEKLRALNFESRPFPYLDTLASCYFDLKRWDDAIAAWRGIETDHSFPELLRQRAESRIALIELEKRVQQARAETFANPEEAVRVSQRLLSDAPEQPAAIAFHVDALHYAGRDTEALAFIKQRQASWPGPGPFPYQRLLAHCEMNLKAWDRAQEAFGSMIDDPVFDEQARSDASRSIQLTGVARLGEAAAFAAEKGEEEEARQLLAELRAKYPNELEALGYEATVRARLGEKDEALKMIEDKKRELAGRGPFKLQDTLGSLYIERKEFAKAREAFQAILDDKRCDWDERSLAMRGLKSTRKAELLDVAYRALQDRRTTRAQLANDQLREEFGADTPEALILDAEILLAQNKVVRAREALQDIEATTPATKVFSAQTSLASAQLRSGQWEKATERFRSILARPLSVTPAELMQARWEVRDAIAIARPAATASATYRQDDDGRTTTVEARYQSPWMGKWRAGTFAKFSDISLKHQSAGTGSDSFAEGGAALQRTFGDRFAAELRGGISGDEGLYGLRVGNFINPGLQWSAAFTGNARSEESTLLAAAGARENRAEVRLSGPITGPWNLDASAYAFWMNLNDSDVGNGVGANALLEYVVQTETPSRPEIGIGYIGHWQRFSERLGHQQRALFDGEMNQHGLQVAVRKALTDRLRFETSGSAYYAFDEDTIGYALGVGLHYYLTDSTSLFADLRYNSQNNSAGSGSGGSLEATIGASVSF